MAKAQGALKKLSMNQDSLEFSNPVRIRTLVVDDSPSYLEVICALIERDQAIDIIGRAADGADAIKAVAELQPDVVLMDIDMPRMNGLSAALILSENFQATKIVMMSSEDSLDARLACLACGASAFIAKSKIHEDIAAKLRYLFDNNTPIPAVHRAEA